MHICTTVSTWQRLLNFDELPDDDPDRVDDEVQPAFPLPEDLAAVTDEQLQDLIEQATDRFDEVRGGDIDEGTLAELTELRDAIRTLRTEGERRETAAAEARRLIDELDAEIHPVDDEGDPPNPDDPPADDPPNPDDPPADDPPADDPEHQEGRQPVAAAASRRAPLRAVAAGAPRPRTTPRGRTGDELNGISITAAADVPGLGAGARVRTLDQLAEAMHDKAAALRDGGSAPLARIHYPIGEADTVQIGQDPMPVLNRIMAPASLTAAGGWCGPLEPLYNLCRLDAADGLFDLPTFRVRRGGVSVPSPIVMPANLSTLGWKWTNADDTAASAPENISNLALTTNVLTVDTGAAHGLSTGSYVTLHTSTAGFQFLDGQVVGPITVTDADTFTVPFTHANVASAAATGTAAVGKPCIRIPCPTWSDYMLEAYGICVTHGNLSDRSFPEMTREYIQMVMNAHQHAMSAAAIAAVVAGSTAVDGPEITGVFNSVFGAAELAAEFYREKYRMARGALLEIVLPQWAPVVIRADLAARQGRDSLSISDQEINAEWATRRLRPQYVQDYQTLAGATAYPTTLSYLIYPAGTWGRGTGGSLDLGVQRDSTLNATNDFTAAWTEEFTLVAKLCAESLNVTSTIAVNGITGCCP